MSTCTKVSFGSEAMANEDIKRIKNKSTRQVVPTRAYNCNKCGGWHLTSQPNWIVHTKNLECKIEILETKVKSLEGLNSSLRIGEIGKFVKKNEQQKQTIDNRNVTIKKLQKTNVELMDNLIKANIKLNTK
jgi:hypothetical protein